MKIKELREKTDVELDKMLAEFRSKRQDQQFAIAGRRMKRVREVRDVRKGIAQILTLKKERASEAVGSTKKDEVLSEARQAGRVEG